MRESLPLVSICLPTFNGEKFLQEALESVKIQTYPFIEVVISDDQSNDGTLKLANEFRSEVYFNVQIFRHEPTGIGGNWNNCVLKSKGEFIKFLFQDDILKEDCIEKMVNLARKNEALGLVYCRRDFLLERKDKRTKLWLSKYSDLHIHWRNFKVKDKEIRDGKKYLKDPNFLKQPINKIGEPTAVLVKRECFKKIGLFDVHLRQELDAEMWYRIMKFYKVGFLDEKLVSFRLHSNQATQANLNKHIPDKKLMPSLLFKNLFWYLHPISKWKLLKRLIIKR